MLDLVLTWLFRVLVFVAFVYLGSRAWHHGQMRTFRNFTKGDRKSGKKVS